VLAIGVFVAGIVQLAFQLPFVVKMGLLQAAALALAARGRAQDRPADAAGDLRLLGLAGGACCSTR
jgi:hypothetical protein